MQGQPKSRSGSKWKWVLLGFLAIVAYFLFTEHRAHFLGLLPFLLLVACPLLHLFMHRNHGGHRSDDGPPHHDSESNDVR